MNNQTENNNDSRKEDILTRSRQSGNDERADFAQSNESRLSWITLAIVSAPLLVFARMSELDYVFDLVISTLIATVFASSIAVPIYAYRFTKDKKYLVEGIVSLVFIIFSAGRAIHIMMGW